VALLTEADTKGKQRHLNRDWFFTYSGALKEHIALEHKVRDYP